MERGLWILCGRIQKELVDNNSTLALDTETWTQKRVSRAGSLPKVVSVAYIVDDSR